MHLATLDNVPRVSLETLFVFEVKSSLSTISPGGDSPVGRVMSVAKVPLGINIEHLASFHVDGLHRTIAVVENVLSSSLNLNEVIWATIAWGLAFLRERALLPGVCCDEHFLVDI